mmetsp:Transcript_102251/g.181557  ORF Transcript_102251/g.181557 Transcript_102251/m.181557 type:complete len:484 (+) Transcript_102251:57-1508(+)
MTLDTLASIPWQSGSDVGFNTWLDSTRYYVYFQWWLAVFFPIFSIAIAAVWMLPKWRCQKAEDSKPHTEMQSVAPEELPASQPQPKPRMAYLDALKVWLTLSVVVFHCNCTLCNDFSIAFNIYVCEDIHAEFTNGNCLKHWFIFGFGHEWRDLNNEYFMLLFFFISGVLTPSSLDRKGAYDFIRERVKRLGLPALAWYLLLGPLLSFVSFHLMGARVGYGNNGSWICGGPPWFIVVLLAFNVIYAVSHEGNTKVALPSLAVFLMIGAMLGWWQEAIGGDEPFLIFANGVQQLLGSAVFFSAGILAKRNNWLQALEQWSTTKIRVLQGLSLGGVGVCFLGNILGALHEQRITGLQSGIVYGIWKVAVSLTLLDLFRRRFNAGGSITTFLVDAHYTVYLIHPYIVTLAVCSYPVILKGCGLQVEKVWTDPPLNKLTHGGVQMAFLVEGGEGLLWLGFLYTVSVTLIIVWPFAWLLRKMPLLNQVL